MTAFLDGEAEEYWVEDPADHPFFSWPAKGWLQAQLHRIPGMQEGEDPDFPLDQFYLPPEAEPRKWIRISATAADGVLEETYELTKGRITERRGADDRWQRTSRALRALRVNPSGLLTISTVRRRPTTAARSPSDA